MGGFSHALTMTLCKLHFQLFLESDKLKIHWSNGTGKNFHGSLKAKSNSMKHAECIFELIFDSLYTCALVCLKVFDNYGIII